jgi:hypothetical protein
MVIEVLISGWLRSLGLEEYEGVFRENKVDCGIDTDWVDPAQQKEAVVCCAALPVASVTIVFQ